MRSTLGLAVGLSMILGGAGCAPAPLGAIGSGGYDGSYCGTAVTVTPGGATTGAVTFSCSGGSCADPSGTFTGSVSSSGFFSGSTRVCGACATFPMSGQMSTTSAFTISGSSGGGSSQTVTASSCGGGGGGGGGDTTPPAKPTGVTATAVSITRVDLGWSEASDDVGVAGYAIYRNGGASPIQTVTSGLSTSDAGLEMQTQYCYTIVAYDAAGNRSAPSDLACATTPCETVPPTTPQLFSAAGRSESEIKTSWQESSDSGGGAVAGYRLYRDGTPVATVPPPVNPMTVTWTDGGRARLTRYCYDVEAFDTCGNVSDRSAQSCVATLGILVSGAPAPERIAVDASRVYWVDGGTSKLMSVALSDGTVAELASPVQGNALATDGSDVFYGEMSVGLRAVPAGGGTPVTLAESVYGVDLAVDATTVYVAAAGLLTRVPMDGGSPVHVAASPHRLALDETQVYFTEHDTGAVMTAPRGGGAATPVASGRNGPYAIAVDATHVYWTEDGSGGGTAALRRRRKDLSEPLETLLVRPNASPNAIAVDATDVYWIESTGVYAVGVDGANFRMLADRAGWSAAPYDMVMDATRIYWTERYGQAVMATLK